MIGLFGGSFDPIHHGHLITAQEIRERLGLTEIRFVPTNEQPFKVGRHGATAEHRGAMVARAIAGQPGFVLERVELDRPGPSYTVHTLRILREREPAHRFILLVGADAAAELDGWREAGVIPTLAEVVAFGRPGAAAPRSPLIARTLEVPGLDISATDIRRRVSRGLSIRYWVPDAVADYISAHGLYRDGEG